jgi:hypothetical protein
MQTRPGVAKRTEGGAVARRLKRDSETTDHVVQQREDPKQEEATPPYRISTFVGHDEVFRSCRSMNVADGSTIINPSRIWPDKSA